MNYNQLLTFIDLANSGSFSKTASALFITQPSVTQRICSLESELGFRLFERKRGSAVRITEAGIKLLPYAQQILLLLKEYKEAVNDCKVETISLGLAHSLSNTLVSKFVEAFKKNYPEVLFTIKLDKMEQILNMLYKGQIEVAFIRSDRKTLSKYKRIAKMRIYKDRIVPFCAPGYSLKQQKVASSDLFKEPVIAYSQESNYWKSIANYFSQFGIRPKVVIETDDLELIKKLVSLRLGISFLAESYIKEEVVNGKFLIIELCDVEGLERSPFLVYMKQNETKPILIEFIKFVNGIINRQQGI